MIKESLAFILFFSLAACKESGKGGDARGSGGAQSTKAAAGNGNWVNERRYENQTFGLYFQAPDGWFLKKQQNIQAVQNALDLASVTDESVKYGISSHYNPFWVHREDPQKVQGAINASFQAAPIPPKLVGKSSLDAVNELRAEYKQMGEFVFTDAPRLREANGITWAYQEINYQIPETKAKWMQHVFMKIQSGYLLTYAISHQAEEDPENVRILERAIGAL